MNTQEAILETLQAMQAQLQETTAQIGELKAQNLSLQEELTALKADTEFLRKGSNVIFEKLQDHRVKTAELTLENIKKVACEAVEDSTYNIEAMNGFAKVMAENFTGVAVYFDETQDLIKANTQRLLKELPSITANKVYIPTRSAKLF